MSFLNSLFGWLEDLLRDIWKAFKIVLPYIAIALALWVGLVGALPLTWLGITAIIPAGWVSALFFVGVSYILAPEETSAVVLGATEAIGDAVTVVAATAGAAVGTGVSALADSSGISTFFIVGGCALAAYLLMQNRKDTDQISGSTSSSDDSSSRSSQGVAHA